MDRGQLKQLITGAVTTVATPFDDDFQVDYSRMAETAQWWVDQGLLTGKAVIKVAAAMGEGPQLRDTEWPRLLQTLVEAVDGKVPVVCGLHYKDTLRTIEDAKIAQDLGAIGLQISPPIFNDPNQDDMLRYYEAVSDAIDIGIVVYNTHWQYCGSILPGTFAKMADFEHIVAIKWNPPPGIDYEAVYGLADTFNIIDNSDQPVRCHRLGGRGFINLTADVHPPFDLMIWDLLESGQYDRAQAEWDRVYIPLRAFYLRVVGESGGQGRVKKGLMDAIGKSFGASRPPSLPMSPEEMDELRGMLHGFGWPVPDYVSPS
jgi:dihydrodipicolinate synthase/N-acetylneuraminate lyase